MAWWRRPQSLLEAFSEAAQPVLKERCELLVINNKSVAGPDIAYAFVSTKNETIYIKKARQNASLLGGDFIPC